VELLLPDEDTAAGDSLLENPGKSAPYSASTSSASTSSSSSSAPASTSAPCISSSAASIFVLDCVVERKTMADLAASIPDKRYVEQKSRLQAAGVRSSVYLVEGERVEVPAQCIKITVQHLKTAIIEINAVFGLNVMRTRNMEHSISCLHNMHRQVEARFRKLNPNPHIRHLYQADNCSSASSSASASTSISTSTYAPTPVPQYQTFLQYQSLYGKKGARTNRQLFGRQLMQIQGCSACIGTVITHRFPTLALFVAHMRSAGANETEKLLACMLPSGSQKKVGPKLAARIVKAYDEIY